MMHCRVSLTVDLESSFILGTLQCQSMGERSNTAVGIFPADRYRRQHCNDVIKELLGLPDSRGSSRVSELRRDLALIDRHSLELSSFLEVLQRTKQLASGSSRAVNH